MKKTYEAMSVRVVGAVSTIVNKSGTSRDGSSHKTKTRRSRRR